MTEKICEQSIGEVIQKLNDRVPLATCEEWDNVGLLLGDPSWTTLGAVVSIDLTEEAIELAVQKNYRLILNHHPCIFPKNRGLSRILSDSLVYKALQKGIAVAAHHTNFDRCALEVIRSVSEGLQIRPRGRLNETAPSSLIKLVTFVPSTHLEEVRAAICEAGAGHIGNYDSCTFGMEGEGTFRGSDQTQPYIGKPGRLEKVREIRIETIFPKGMKEVVLAALRSAHPYEEVAYDLYPLEQVKRSEGLNRGIGYGFWGDFPSPKPFAQLANDVKSLFNIDGFLITHPYPATVTRVGFVAGKGASFVDVAAFLGCDLFITGEAGYHTALGGLRRGMAVMELGHRESEKFFTVTIGKWLTELNLEFAEASTPTQKIWT